MDENNQKRKAQPKNHSNNTVYVIHYYLFSSELQRVENHLAGDPSYLTINGWNIAITSNDVSMQMINAERNFIKNSKRDKFTRVS